MKGIELDDAAIAVSQLLHLLGIFLAVPISKDVKHHRTMGIIFKDTDKACAQDLKIAVIDVIGNVKGRCPVFPRFERSPPLLGNGARTK